MSSSNRRNDVNFQIAQPDAAKAWILDGFPRTLAQAEALDRELPAGRKLTHVVYFALPEQVLMARLTGRRTCSKCGAIWHVQTKPTKVEGVCDQCGGKTVQRSDDHPDKITQRLVEYRTLTAPLLDYYRRRNLLRPAGQPGTPAALRHAAQRRTHPVRHPASRAARHGVDHGAQAVAPDQAA